MFMTHVNVCVRLQDHLVLEETALLEITLLPSVLGKEMKASALRYSTNAKIIPANPCFLGILLARVTPIAGLNFLGESPMLTAKSRLLYPKPSDMCATPWYFNGR